MVTVSKKYGVTLITLLFMAGFLLFTQTNGVKSRIAASRLNVWGFSSPTPTPPSVVVQMTNVHSPDGTLKADMRKVSEVGGKVTYSLFTSKVGGDDQHILYVDSPVAGATFSIPLNSWSPDNAYMFLEGKSPTGLIYLVFKANGEPFADGAKYIRVSDLFSGSKLGYILRSITGWDSPSLLHVQTSDAQNNRGPSYWFDLYSQTFIQLGNY